MSKQHSLKEALKREIQQRIDAVHSLAELQVLRTKLRGLLDEMGSLRASLERDASGNHPVARRLERGHGAWGYEFANRLTLQPSGELFLEMGVESRPNVTKSAAQSPSLL